MLLDVMQREVNSIAYEIYLHDPQESIMGSESDKLWFLPQQEEITKRIKETKGTFMHNFSLVLGFFKNSFKGHYQEI